MELCLQLSACAIILFTFYKILDTLLRIPFVGKYDQRYVMITGCDTGFGHDAAIRFDRMGCHVFATCLTEKGQQKLKACCSNQLHTLYMDVTKIATIQDAYDYVNNKLPDGMGLWTLLNNAGVWCSTAPIDWLEHEDYQRVLDVNLLGAIDVVQTFLPLVRKSRGRVVIVSSMAGRVSTPGLTPYCISKYGIEAFSDALRRQMCPFGVGVHLIEPGAYRTPIVPSLELVAHDLRTRYERASAERKIYYNEAYIEKNIRAAAGVTSQMSERTEGVVDAYVHASLACFPRTRYIVGLYAKLVCLMQFLPEAIFDHMLVTGGPNIRDFI